MLVHLLMDRGPYVQACQVLCRAFQGGQDDHRGGGMVTDRLPEEWSINYIPYDMIDALWNWIEEEQSDPDCGIERKRHIIEAHDGSGRGAQEAFPSYEG